MKRIYRSNPKQIEYALNISTKFLYQYINADLSKDEVWKSIVDDANEIADKVFNDELTVLLIFAICQYFEEIYKSERGDKPVLIEKKITGFTPETEIKGFKVGE